MQCIVKCLDLPTPSASGGLFTQKVAVKLPVHGNHMADGDFGQFADIMAALMQLPTDQLHSLEEQSAWVSVDGGAKQWLPLIDLSQSAGENSEMIQMLLNGPMGQGPVQPGNTLSTLRQIGIQEALTNGQNTGPFPKSRAVAIPAGSEAVLANESGNGGQTSVQPELNPLSQTNGQTVELELAAGGQSKITDATVSDSKQAAQGQAETKSAADAKQNSASLFQNMNQSAQRDSSQADHNSAQAQAKATAPLNQSATKDMTLSSAATSGDTPSQLSQKADGHPLTGATLEKSASSVEQQTTEQKSGMQKALNAAIDNQRPEVKHESLGQADGKATASTDSGINNDPTATTANSSNQTTSPILETPVKAAHTHVAEQPHSAQDATTTDLKTHQNDVIRQIVQRMTLQTNGRQSQMNIQLKPEFLGNLRMEVVTENHQVMVRMAAENHAVREMIEHNIHVLKSELEQHGLQVQKVDVYVAQNGDQWKNGRRHQYSQQHRGQRKGHGKDEAAPVEMNSGHATTTSEQIKARNANHSEVDFFA